MFDIAWGEFVVIAVVALIVIGPKELPGVLRAIGQWTTKIRRMAAEFQGQFQEALREAEMADLKKEVDNLNDTAKDAAKGFTSQFDDPLNLKEATKWEPKTDVAAPDAANPADAVTQSAPVTPDGYASGTTTGGMPDAAVSAAAEPAVSAAAEHTAIEHVPASAGPEEASASANQSVAQPPLPEGSGQGGVHP